MDELGLDIQQVLSWFPHAQDEPYVLIRVSDEHSRTLGNALSIAVRRCYITDALLDERAQAMGVSRAEILSAKLPDAGSTMAGDFGEILAYLYHAAREGPSVAFGPKKWRLKQDRTKPAPYSDVILFVLPSWPAASEHDRLLCSEVKTKSTASTFAPLTAAIADSVKDRVSRLAKSLVWLRERALIEDLGSVSIAHLDRFINATEHPPFGKSFRAVAVVCESLVAGELATAPTVSPTDYTVVLISIPELRDVYTSVFESTRGSVSTLVVEVEETQ